MLVKDVMHTDVKTVKPSLNIVALMKLFREYHFHRFPVVDDENHMLGTINIESVLTIFKPHRKHLTRLLRASPSLKVEEEDIDILDVSVTPEWAHLTLVADIMETNFIPIAPDKTISEACSLMQLHNIQGLPVLDNDALVGVITLFDIIYAVLRERGVIE
jgi:acetoin utilization protein AcuB